MDKFYKPKDIAKMFDVNLMTVYRHITSGKIKAIRFGREWRISEKVVEELKNSGITWLIDN